MLRATSSAAAYKAHLCYLSSCPVVVARLSCSTRPSRATCRLHRRHSSGTARSPQLAFELRPLRISDDGELLKPDGELSEDEDAALRRRIAALVLNLRGIDPDLRESGLDVLSSLATRRSPSLVCQYWPDYLLVTQAGVQKVPLELVRVVKGMLSVCTNKRTIGMTRQ